MKIDFSFKVYSRSPPIIKLSLIRLSDRAEWWSHNVSKRYLECFRFETQLGAHYTELGFCVAFHDVS
jgi:hypothetical protein